MRGWISTDRQASKYKAALGRSQQASQEYFQACKSGNLHTEIAHFTNNRLAVLDEIGYPIQ